jgi:hypothetical protein
MTDMQKVEAPNRVNGRPIKFTPEKIEQIKNLVERGRTREEIAEILDLTVGSLQVTCSRLGISLRGIRSINPPKPRPPRPPKPKAPAPQMTPSAISLELILRYKDQEKTVELPAAAVDHLLMEAAFSDRSISAVIGDLIQKWIARQAR